MQRDLFARMQREKMPVERNSVTHSSVWRARGLHYGRDVRRRAAGRSLHQDVEGRLDAFGVMDGLALTIFTGLAIRRTNQVSWTSW